MIELTTISWWVLLFGCILLFVIWLLSTKTRYGRMIINRETPWNIRQWTTILVIIAITMFILVNPVFHLLTTSIFAILYYIFVNRNVLGRKIKLGSAPDAIRNGLEFGDTGTYKVDFECRGLNFNGEVAERKALDRCLFSFLTSAENPFPEVNYIDGIYHIEGELSSKKYYSSLIQYIQKAGFEIKSKNKK